MTRDRLSPACGKDWPGLQSSLVLSNGQNLKIGHSLFRGLATFQELGIFRCSWIDGICINQEDVEERKAQVATMDDICRRQQWLGLAKRRGLRSEAGRPMEREGGGEVFSYSFGDPRLYERLNMEEISKHMLEGLASFLKRARSRRAWTFKEIPVAKEVKMYCGAREIGWGRLETFLNLLNKSDWNMHINRFLRVAEVQQMPGMVVLSTIWQRRYFANCRPFESLRLGYLKAISGGGTAKDLMLGYLEDFLYRTRCGKANDERDHVYALYGMLTRSCRNLKISNPLVQPNCGAKLS